MSAAEKLAEAGIHKAKGTDAFKAGKFSAAMSSYRNAAGYVDTDADFDTDEQKAQASQPVRQWRTAPTMGHRPTRSASQSVSGAQPLPRGIGPLGQSVSEPASGTQPLPWGIGSVSESGQLNANRLIHAGGGGSSQLRDRHRQRRLFRRRRRRTPRAASTRLRPRSISASGPPRATGAPRLRATWTPRLRATRTPRLRATRTPRLRATWTNEVASLVVSRQVHDCSLEGRQLRQGSVQAREGADGAERVRRLEGGSRGREQARPEVARGAIIHY